jgi:lipopolysaccharide/colanic/teichoic acid biosynthesis glycosyltransferase
MITGIDAEQSKQELLEQNEMDGGTTLKMKHHPRVTRVWRCIRKASVDELPQLRDVFVGDMPLVVTRPPAPPEVGL